MTDRFDYKPPDDLKWWVTSDHHWLHKNIAAYVDRPDNHNELMIERWNSCVSDNDIVIHLGDLTFGNKRIFQPIAEQLAGTKYLVRGNHDARTNTFYRDVGFEPIWDFDLRLGDLTIAFSHVPRVPLHHRRWLCVHGHLHQDFIRDDRFINVCVDQTAFYPVWADKLISR